MALLLVIYIPKTAGTSFRTALASQFGAKRLAFDYGAQAPVTSSQIQEHLYAEGADGDIPALVERLRTSGCEALVGHFNCMKYRDCFSPADMIAFVREPLVRTCSEYLHRIKAETFSGTFEEFVETPLFQNMQSGTLHGCPDDMFIGVTERYRESLQLINERFGLKLGRKRRNRGARGGGQRMAGELQPGLVARCYELNQADAGLYVDVRSKSKRLFEARAGSSYAAGARMR